MKVLLAGYNVDTEVLEDLKKTSHQRQDVTPETLSASYARISRDPRPIDELRKDARAEVAKARKSNSAIIFKMGHHSIAEHAVFNFDIIGVSRLAFEEIEKFRLCAYTEKSQRYQKLEDDFIVPEEIKGSEAEKIFIETIKAQNKFYHQLVEKGIEPEDARYATSLATQGQVGLTINARNLEFLFRRFASHPLVEIQKLGREMYSLVKDIAPSIILFAEANDFDQKTNLELKTRNAKLKTTTQNSMTEVQLVDSTSAADNKVIAALVHSSTNLSYTEALDQAKKMGDGEKKELIKTCFKYAEFYDRPLREFEYVDLTYDLIMSAACFGQLKRHRMTTQTVQPYDPNLGMTIPPAIDQAEFMKVVELTNKAYAQLVNHHPLAAQYVLTNAHRRRVLLKTNARELYHISRLREDQHAQWDIQNLSRGMTKLAKEVMPLTMMFVGSKAGFVELYEAEFGHKPKVLPQF